MNEEQRQELWTEITLFGRTDELEKKDKHFKYILSFIDQLAAEQVGKYFTKKEVALLSRIVDGFLVMNDSYSEQQEAITIKGKLQKLQSGEQNKVSGEGV